LRKRLQGGVSSPLQGAFQLSDLLIGFDDQAPPLAFVPQFQQGVLQQRQSAGMMAHGSATVRRPWDSRRSTPDFLTISIKPTFTLLRSFSRHGE